MVLYKQSVKPKKMLTVRIIVVLIFALCIIGAIIDPKTKREYYRTVTNPSVIEEPIMLQGDETTSLD